MADTLHCPICGSELTDLLEVPETFVEGEGIHMHQVEPKGGVMVCTGCNAAVHPDEALGGPLPGDGTGPTEEDIAFHVPREAPVDTEVPPQDPVEKLPVIDEEQQDDDALLGAGDIEDADA